MRDLVLQRNKEVNELRDFAETERLSYESCLLNQEFNKENTLTDGDVITTKDSETSSELIKVMNHVGDDSKFNNYLNEIVTRSVDFNDCERKASLAKATRAVTIIG
mgnify:FL=1